MATKKIYKDGGNGRFTTKQKTEEDKRGTYTQTVEIPEHNKSRKPVINSAADAHKAFEPEVESEVPVKPKLPQSMTEVINEILDED